MITTAVLSASIAALVNGSLIFVVWRSLDRRFLELEDRKLWGIDDLQAEIKRIEHRYIALDVRLKKVEERETA